MELTRLNTTIYCYIQFQVQIQQQYCLLKYILNDQLIEFQNLDSRGLKRYQKITLIIWVSLRRNNKLQLQIIYISRTKMKANTKKSFKYLNTMPSTNQEHRTVTFMQQSQLFIFDTQMLRLKTTTVTIIPPDAK